MRAITLGFLVFVGLLVGVELVTRFGFVKTMEGRFDYGYHPTAGFVDTGDGQVELMRTGGRRFFPQSFQKERPVGVYRVMVVGDSVARGKNVKESYAGQLEKVLRDQGIQAECLNLGLPGYGARRKDVVVQQVLNYQPSLVILHVGTSNEYEDEREWRRKNDFNPAHPQNWLMNSLALRQFYEIKMEKIYWQWLPREVRNQEGIFDVNAELRASADLEIQKEWNALVETETLKSIQRLHEAHVPTLLVTQATKRTEKDGSVSLDDSTVDGWTTNLVADDLIRLPMKEVFTLARVPALYTDSNHVRTEGHQLIAQAIARLLKEKGWLPEPAQK